MDIAGSLYPTGRIGTTNYILTPENIVNDMINMLPDDFWTPDIKVLDIFSKSGRFLMAAYKKLFNSSYLADMDIAKRKHHILSEQLYGITDDFTCLMLSESALYGYAQYGKKNIRMIEDLQSIVKTTDKKLVAERLGKELGGQMEFDLVIGNPPYNKGADIDFVFLGCELSSKYVCMITPAKWQTADANQRISSKMSYGQFREKLVPHMKYVCFYPACKDVFNILQADGIAWFILDKQLHEKCVVENKCKHTKWFNGVTERNIRNGQSLFNIGNEIIEYLGNYKAFTFSKYLRLKRFQVWTNTQVSGGGMSTQVAERQTYFVGESHIEDMTRERLEHSNSQMCSFSSDSRAECESFMSWLNCKFTRFFVAVNISKTTVMDDNTFRFVPCPPHNSFDHLYTDKELYDWFNLPEEYRVVIDSILRDRK